MIKVEHVGQLFHVCDMLYCTNDTFYSFYTLNVVLACLACSPLIRYVVWHVSKTLHTHTHRQDARRFNFAGLNGSRRQVLTKPTASTGGNQAEGRIEDEFRAGEINANARQDVRAMLNSREGEFGNLSHLWYEWCVSCLAPQAVWYHQRRQEDCVSS